MAVTVQGYSDGTPVTVSGITNGVEATLTVVAASGTFSTRGVVLRIADSADGSTFEGPEAAKDGLISFEVIPGSGTSIGSVSIAAPGAKAMQITPHNTSDQVVSYTLVTNAY